MSQAVIQGIVSEMADAFIAAGLADPGEYRTPGYPDDGSAIIECRVFLKRQRGIVGDFGSVVTDAYEITLLLSEISNPQRDANIFVDGANYKLVQLLIQDDAVSTWKISRVAG